MWFSAREKNGLDEKSGQIVVSFVRCPRWKEKRGAVTICLLCDRFATDSKETAQATSFFFFLFAFFIRCCFGVCVEFAAARYVFAWISTCCMFFHSLMAAFSRHETFCLLFFQSFFHYLNSDAQKQCDEKVSQEWDRLWGEKGWIEFRRNHKNGKKLYQFKRNPKF